MRNLKNFENQVRRDVRSPVLKVFSIRISFGFYK